MERSVKHQHTLPLYQGLAAVIGTMHSQVGRDAFSGIPITVGLLAFSRFPGIHTVPKTSGRYVDFGRDNHPSLLHEQ